MANELRLRQNYMAGRLLYDAVAASTAVADGVTNSTTTITSATAAFTPADVGAPISGTDIPAGAYIATYVNATTVTISAAATGTGVARAWTISREKVLHSSAFTQFSTVGTTQHQMATVDPDGLAGAPETVMVTRHDAATGWCQVTRALEGSAVRAHAAGMDWVHGALNSDLEMPVAKVYRSAALNVATGGVDIAWDAEDEDLWGFHDNVTNNARLTVPTGYGGTYLVGGAIHLNVAGTAGKIMSIYISKSGSPVRGAEAVLAQATSFNPGLTLAIPVRLAAGDWVTFGSYIDNAAAVAMNLTKSTFWAQRIAA